MIIRLTHLSSGYLSVILNIKSDAVCGTMEPDRPRSASGIRRGCLSRFPDGLFREVLRVAEFFDLKIRVLKGGIA